MRTDILGEVNQIPIDVLQEGDTEMPKLSKLGQLFTANWQTRLVMAGKVFRMSIGTVTGAGDVTKVGVGTALDLDQPFGLIAIDSGYLIPIELDLGLEQDADAEGDETQVLLTADRTTAVSAAEILAMTATTETPDNLLDGAEAFGGRAFSIATADITEPVHNDILFYKRWEWHQYATATQGGQYTCFNVNKIWDYPNVIAAPCTMLLYAGGTTAVTGLGSLVFAHIPASYVVVS